MGTVISAKHNKPRRNGLSKTRCEKALRWAMFIQGGDKKKRCLGTLD